MSRSVWLHSRDNQRAGFVAAWSPVRQLAFAADMQHGGVDRRA
jgi:hypothetical protein